jgi:hypothetical protein
VFFSISSKKQQPPLQSRGTRLHAPFTLRKQSPPQVTPVEGLIPLVLLPFVCRCFAVVLQNIAKKIHFPRK